MWPGGASRGEGQRGSSSPLWGTDGDGSAERVLEQVREPAVPVGTWPLPADSTPRMSVRATRLRLLHEVSLRADPIAPDTLAECRDPATHRIYMNSR